MCGVTPADEADHAPETDTDGPEPGIHRRRKLDHSGGGPLGAQVCQAAVTFAACDHGHVNENTVSWESACVANVKDVTTPKFPPPPPRSDQNRSDSDDAFAVTVLPSASTTIADVNESHVSPNCRPITPCPPPIVSPLMPTVAHVPPGNTLPLAASAVATSISRAPGPIVTVLLDGCGCTADIPDRSITMPLDSE